MVIINKSAWDNNKIATFPVVASGSFLVTPEHMPKESYILIMPNGNISCDLLEITKKLREREQLLMLQKMNNKNLCWYIIGNIIFLIVIIMLVNFL